MNSSQSCCRVDVDEDLIANAKSLLKSKAHVLSDKSKLFSLLANAVRLKIVTLFLNYEKMCVCDLADVLEMKQSPISQHLRKLKDGGILDNQREGMTVFYFIIPKIKSELNQLIQG